MTKVSRLWFQWSPVYRAEWDRDAAAYVAAGAVGWGRSRRLLRGDDPARRCKAYIGVHHSDPARWGLPGEPTAKFFLSLFVAGRTVALRACRAAQSISLMR
jgi:hypothetical protein